MIFGLCRLALAAPAALYDPTIGTGSGGSLPAFNVQRFHAAADGNSLWTDNTDVGANHRIALRGVASYAYRPLVYVDADGLVSGLVENVVQLDLLGGYTLGPARLAVDVPLYLRAFGGIGSDETDIGDVAADLKVRLLDVHQMPVGLAVAGRAIFPTSSTAGLSSGGFGGEASVILDGTVGPAWIAANLGASFRPAGSVENASWSPVVPLVRLAGDVAVRPNLALTLDANTEVGLQDALAGNADFLATLPAEALLGLRWQSSPALSVRFAAGTAISPGIGAPSARALLGLEWTHSPETDRDGDQLLDRADTCPGEPEDRDGFEDTDGCPEPTTLSLRFVDAVTKAEIPGVISGIAGREGKNSRVLSLAADSYALQASAPGYQTVRLMVEVPSGPAAERTIELSPEIAQGRLVLRVIDETGRPIEASLTVPGTTLDRPVTEFDRLVPAGSITIVATRTGYLPVTQVVTVAADGTATVTLKMISDTPPTKRRK